MPKGFPVTKRKDWTIPVHYDPAVSSKELGDLFGLTAVRIQQLVKEGLPKRAHGKYPLKRCCQWIRDYWKSRATRGADATEFREARNRKLEAQAQLIEVKLEKARGNTIPIDAIMPCWEGVVTLVVNALSGLPEKLAQTLYKAKSPARVAHILDAEVKRIQEAIADAEIEIEPTV